MKGKTKKIKFALQMKDDIEVRTLQELKEAFDLNKTVSYFLDGKLETWLSDRYYDDLAEQIQSLDKSDPKLRRKLCEIFEAEYEDGSLSVEEIEERNRRIQKLKEVTDDEDLIKNIDSIAFCQEDLADLLDEGAETIYLCGTDFHIPSSKKGITYIGIKTKLDITQEERKKYQSNNIELIDLLDPSSNTAWDHTLYAVTPEQAKRAAKLGLEVKDGLIDVDKYYQEEFEAMYEWKKSHPTSGFVPVYQIYHMTPAEYRKWKNDIGAFIAELAAENGDEVVASDQIGDPEGEEKRQTVIVRRVWEQERLDRLKKFTSHKAIIERIDHVAFNQEELDALVAKRLRPIYLCIRGAFKIPTDVPCMDYINVGGKFGTIDIERTEFTDNGIHLYNWSDEDANPFGADGRAKPYKILENDYVTFNGEDIKVTLFKCFPDGPCRMFMDTGNRAKIDSVSYQQMCSSMRRKFDEKHKAPNGWDDDMLIQELEGLGEAEEEKPEIPKEEGGGSEARSRTEVQNDGWYSRSTAPRFISGRYYKR